MLRFWFGFLDSHIVNLVIHDAKHNRAWSDFVIIYFHETLYRHGCIDCCTRIAG